jgi:hypothetical protein
MAIMGWKQQFLTKSTQFISSALRGLSIWGPESFKHWCGGSMRDVTSDVMWPWRYADAMRDVTFWTFMPMFIVGCLLRWPRFRTLAFFFKGYLDSGALWSPDSISIKYRDFGWVEVVLLCTWKMCILELKNVWIYFRTVETSDKIWS